MFNYFRSELYRIINKRSMWLTVLGLMVGFLLLMVLTTGGFNFVTVDYVDIARQLLQMSPIIFVTIALLAIYTDDFTNRTLSNAVAGGVSKVSIVLVKMMLFVLLTVVMYIALGIFYTFVWVLVTGFIPSLSATQFNSLLNSTIVVLTTAFGYGALATLVGFATQKTVMTLVMWFLGTSGALSGIVFMILSLLKVPELSEYLLYFRSGKMLAYLKIGSGGIEPIFYYTVLVYIAVSIAGSIFFLRTKDIEV